MSAIQKKQLLDPDILIALKDHKNTEKKIQALQSELRFLQQKTPSLHDTVVSMLQNDLQQVSDLQYYHYIAFSKRIAGETLPPYEEYKIQLHLQCMEKYILMHLANELSVELPMEDDIVQIACHSIKMNQHILLQCPYDTLVDLVTSYQDTIRIKKGKLFSDFIPRTYVSCTPSLDTLSLESTRVSIYKNIFTPEIFG